MDVKERSGVGDGAGHFLPRVVCMTQHPPRMTRLNGGSIATLSADNNLSAFSEATRSIHIKFIASLWCLIVWWLSEADEKGGLRYGNDARNECA